MMPNMNPAQMQKIMKQMGINSLEIPATRVVIETEGGNYIISNPQVTEVTMQGQKSYQIAGTVLFEEGMKEEDVKMVMEQGNVERDKAVDALKKTKGDIAQAILDLQS